MKYNTYDEWLTKWIDAKDPTAKGLDDELLEQYTLMFHNKDYFRKWCYVNPKADNDEFARIDVVHTYNDAILYKGNESTSCRLLCKFILKGQIEIL